MRFERTGVTDVSFDLGPPWTGIHPLRAESQWSLWLLLNGALHFRTLPGIISNRLRGGTVSYVRGDIRQWVPTPPGVSLELVGYVTGSKVTRWMKKYLPTTPPEVRKSYFYRFGAILPGGSKGFCLETLSVYGSRAVVKMRVTETSRKFFADLVLLDRFFGHVLRGKRVTFCFREVYVNSGQFPIFASAVCHPSLSAEREFFWRHLGRGYRLIHDALEGRRYTDGYRKAAQRAWFFGLEKHAESPHPR